MTIIAIAKARHQSGPCRTGARMRPPILLLALLMSACASPPKAVDPVAEVKPVVQSEVKDPPAVDTPPAVTEQQAPPQLPVLAPPIKRDHNIEED